MTRGKESREMGIGVVVADEVKSSFLQPEQKLPQNMNRLV